MTGESRLTRRGALALASSVAVAGCGGLNPTESDSTELDGAALRAAVAGDPPDVPETLPVDIAASHLDDSADRARVLLASVPHPLDAGDVPNGAVRRQLSRAYERAESSLDAAADAGSPFERMTELRRARGHARTVAAGWAAVEGDASFADLHAEAESVRDGVESFRREWWYAGDDAVPAVLVHAATESLVETAVGRTGRVLDPSRDRPETSVAVGERADYVEDALASSDDARHLFDRQVASASEPRDLRATFDAAGRALAETVAERRRDLPDGDLHEPSSYVEGDLGDAPAAAALRDLGRHVDRDVTHGRATGKLATVVVDAHRTLAELGAFEALVGRVERGEHATVTEAADVRSLREDAVAALESAVGAGDHPVLNQALAAEFAGTVARVDERLAETGETASVAGLEWELGAYVAAAAVARATPAASREVAAALRQADTTTTNQ